MKNWMAFWTTLSTMAAVVLSFWAIERPPSTSGEVAAWVQAIGSIFAIMAAIAVAAYQSREARRMAFRQLRIAKFERISPLRALVDFARTLAEEASWEESWIEYEWNPGFWDKIALELDEVEIMTLADHELAAAFLSFESAFSSVLRGIRYIAGKHAEGLDARGPGVEGEDIEWFEERQAEVERFGTRVSRRLIVLEDTGL